MIETEKNEFINSQYFKSIQAIEQHVQTLKQHVQTLKQHVLTLKQHVQTLKQHVQTLKQHVQTLKQHVQTLKEENIMLTKRVDVLLQYVRRPNLRIFGAPVVANE